MVSAYVMQLVFKLLRVSSDAHCVCIHDAGSLYELCNDPAFYKYTKKGVDWAQPNIYEAVPGPSPTNNNKGTKDAEAAHFEEPVKRMKKRRFRRRTQLYF